MVNRFVSQRRRALAVSVAAGLVCVLAACSTSGGGGDQESGDSKPLVVGVTADADTLKPWSATQFQASDILRNLYGTLTELDENLEVVPGLAKDWSFSDDGLTLNMKLREGVTFTDGSEFDAEDVVYSLEKIQDEETAAVAASSLTAVDEVEAVNEHEVNIHLKSPDAALPSKLAPTTLAIVPKDADPEDLEKEPDGTGAFKLKDHKPNESITLESNPDYWGGAPKVPTVEFRVIPDPSAIVSALQAGSIQMSVFDDKLVADTVGDSIDVQKTPTLDYHLLQINARHKPLDDRNVRLALSCAIDRKEVLDSAAMGAGEVIGPITSPNFKSDAKDRPCPSADVDKAKQYLEKAGYGDGLKLKAIVMQGGYSTAVSEAENIQAQLKKAGITLQLETLESGTYVKRWTDADFDLAVALNGASPDPDATYGRYFTKDGSLNKVAGYSSSKLDKLFQQGRAETEEKDRKKVYSQISEELENEAVWIWLFSPYDYTATAKNVKGFKPAWGSLIGLRDVTVE
jgi:peptide/nickel transport system substrate-binding protein